MDQIQIFISYAREDQERVKQFYHRLVEAGFHPWLDREHILPGMKWEPIIKAALKRSDFALVCLSATSINKRGFLQKEIKQALEHAQEKLEDDVWLIPARLDDCDVPMSLSDIQWVDLFEDDGWERLLQALEFQLKRQGRLLPLPVSEQRKPQQEEEEELKRRELQRQRELEEPQRRAEAARLLAEQQRREQELDEQRRRERELADQRRREQELADQQRREEELVEQRRKAEEERKREAEILRRQSAAQQAQQKQPEHSREAKVAWPKSFASLLALPRSRKLFIVAALVIAIIAPIVYFSFNSAAPKLNIPAVRWPDFVTVTLDGHGRLVSTKSGRAEYFTEDLGDGVKLEMVEIPAGDFQMGSSDNEIQAALADAKRYSATATLDVFKDELPKHTVRVPGFYMGRFEVTREQWRQVARWPKVKVDLNEDPSNFKDSWRQPVERVSWAEAVEFCERLQKKTGRAYRLPAEAEWEYAARAGTTTPFAFGPTITPEIVNYHGDYPFGDASKGEYRGKTIPVGNLGLANAFGLFDIHGNVWEWCQDVWHDSYNGAPTDGSAWLSGGDSSRRMLRGGSYNLNARFCRSAYRCLNDARNITLNVGFRVVVSART